MDTQLCPLCRGQSLPLRQPDSSESWRRCLVCSNVFAEGQRGPVAASARSRATVRRIRDQPDTMTVVQRTPPEPTPDVDRYRAEAQSRDDIVIRWSGNRQRKTDGILAALLWGIGLTFLVLDPPVPLDPANEMAWLLYLPFALVGLFILRFFFGNLLNTTTVWVRGHELSVWTSPLPRAPRRDFDVMDIQQLWVERVTRDDEVNDDAFVLGYSLFIRTRQHERIELVRMLETPQQACWLEQQIEDCLGIVDVAVEGEVAPAA